MRLKSMGIYGRVFFYTLLILLFVILVMFAFFSDQIFSVVDQTQRQQISDVFRAFFAEIRGKPEEEIAVIARNFHERNTSYQFRIETAEGRILYETEGFVMPKDGPLPTLPSMPFPKGKALTEQRFGFEAVKGGGKVQLFTIFFDDVKVYVSGVISGMSVYSLFIEKTMIAIALVLLASILAAALFARQIARPIQQIAVNTRRMSNLEEVLPPTPRSDEVGQLADDVYKMYRTLKATIGRLEIEIEKEREMEENQRYFFAAASHELKTPIAAATALLEGMLEKVIPSSEYPAYLRECLRMMNDQSRLVTEILELVSLSRERGNPERVRVNLKAWIAEVMPPYFALADGRGQRIRVDIPEDLHCTVDPSLLRKAFSNVVLNAIQNTPEGGEIRIYADTVGGSTSLSVLNQGAQIPEEILPKLFDPFYREDQARSRRKGRSGLGLTLVKKALDFMEIPFSLENTGEGVLFRMKLPC